MEAGRDLDALVAEKVMGLISFDDESLGKGWHSPDWNKQYYGEELPHYRTDIAAAWQVVEKIHAMDDFDFHVDWWAYRENVQVMTESSNHSPQYRGVGTFPFAVCLAALKAVGVKVE